MISCMVYSASPPDLVLAGVSTVLGFTSSMTFAAGGAFCDWVDVMCLHYLSNESFTDICDRFVMLFTMGHYWWGSVYVFAD